MGFSIPRRKTRLALRRRRERLYRSETRNATLTAMDGKHLGDVVGHALLFLFIASIAAGLVLLSLVTRGERLELGVGRWSQASCPSGEQAQRCYQAVVTNNGDRAANISCVLASVGGGPARFLNDKTAYASAAPLEAHSSLTLTIKLEPSVLASPALPRLSCRPAG